MAIPFRRIDDWRTANPAQLKEQLARQEETISALVGAVTKLQSDASRDKAFITYGWNSQTPTPISTSNTFEAAVCSTKTDSTSEGFSAKTSGTNQVTYTGREPIQAVIHVTVVLSTNTLTVNPLLAKVRLNETEDLPVGTIRTVSAAGNPVTSGYTTFTKLRRGDRISLYVANAGGTSDVRVHAYRLVAVELS